MKALVLHGPGRYSVEADWPEPRVKPGWALVRVHYAGICGSDLPRFAVTGSYHHPMILGHEFSGTVQEPAPGSGGAAGSGRFRPGDPVAILPIIPCGHCAGCRNGGPFHCESYLFLGSRIDGGFAEVCLVPESNLFALPEGTDLRAGAFIEPIAVALHVLRRSEFRPGRSALVFGAGAIGLLVALWLRVFGARRIVIADLRPESLHTARALGFGELWDARDLPQAPSPARLWEEGFDAAFEAAGASPALLAAIDRVRPKGSITVVGRDTRDTTLPLPSFERLMRREITLRGCWGYDLRGEEAFLHEALGRGSFPVAPLVTREVPLDQAPEAIQAMIDRRSYYCKVLLTL